jgi:hypothetical protein
MAVSRHFANSQLAETIDLSAGNVINTKFIDKFGYNSTVGGTFETVWDGNNIYTYIATAGTATATSSNSASDDNGTVEVTGLDANYNEITETLTIGGSAGTQQFYRVFRARMVTPNTGTTNVGNVTITVDSKSAAIITAGYGQTLMALYTVPLKYNAYLIQLDVGAAKDLETEIQVLVRNGTSGSAWNTKAFITKRGGFSEKNWRVPIEIPEKHDIEVRVKGSATTSVSAGFELVLLKTRS